MGKNKLFMAIIYLAIIYFCEIPAQQYMKCEEKRNRGYLKHQKVWCKINLLSSYIQVQNILTSIIMILEFSNKHHCKLDKIPRNFSFEHNW